MDMTLWLLRMHWQTSCGHAVIQFRSRAGRLLTPTGGPALVGLFFQRAEFKAAACYMWPPARLGGLGMSYCLGKAGPMEFEFIIITIYTICIYLFVYILAVVPLITYRKI